MQSAAKEIEFNMQNAAKEIHTSRHNEIVNTQCHIPKNSSTP
jgi:hypothetical protein